VVHSNQFVFLPHHVLLSTDCLYPITLGTSSLPVKELSDPSPLLLIHLSVLAYQVTDFHIYLINDTLGICLFPSKALFLSHQQNFFRTSFQRITEP